MFHFALMLWGAQALDQRTLDLQRMLEKIPVAPRAPTRYAGEVLRIKLASFRGKSGQYAFSRLGYPDKKMSVEGATVYTWLNETSNLDGSPLRCTVKLVVRSGKIFSTDFYGNEGACGRFAALLDPTYTNR